MSASASEAHARQACVSCHSQKRKCSRQWPRCDLCQKKARNCEYPPEALPDTPEAPGRLLENGFPAIFFLDTWLFRKRRLAVPPAQADLPGHAESLLAQESIPALREVVERYFAMVHPSFPVCTSHLSLMRGLTVVVLGLTCSRPSVQAQDRPLPRLAGRQRASRYGAAPHGGPPAESDRCSHLGPNTP